MRKWGEGHSIVADSYSTMRCFVKYTLFCLLVIVLLHLPKEEASHRHSFSGSSALVSISYLLNLIKVSHVRA